MKNINIQKIQQYLSLASLFFIPLKLSWTYIVLIPLILLWLFSNRANFAEKIPCDKIVIAFIFFIFSMLISSMFGIHPSQSLIAILKLTFFSISIFPLIELFQTLHRNISFSFLIAGQSISSAYSVIEALSLGKAKQIFIGPVTESGQIALVFVLLVGFTLHNFLNLKTENNKNSPIGRKYSTYYYLSASFILSCLFSFTAFSADLGFNEKLTTILKFSLLMILSVSLVYWLLFMVKNIAKQQNIEKLNHWFTVGAFPFILSALICNLKRGPWLGVLVGVSLFFILNHKKLLLPFLIACLIAFFSFKPIQQRLTDSSNDFFITGGRNMMWQIGLELSIRYPLGIGYDNSALLRKFDPDIPEGHRHFHNTLLNLVVETGWLSLGIFSWWLFETLKRAFSNSNNVLSQACGCALISWLVAGSVEYNFGDSEVLLVVFLMIAAIISIHGPTKLATSSDFSI